MSESLTALITCKNERRNIRPCVESVREIADEILVADSGSADGTVDIARALGCRILEREYVNPADFKNWAIPQCAHPWVLILDADERATPELRAEIRDRLRADPDGDGYWIGRRNHFFGYEIRHCGWNTDAVIRLIRRDVCRYKTVRVHEEIDTTGRRIGRLRNKFLHYPYWSFDQYLEKFHRYTTWGAQDLHDAGKRSGLLKILTRPLARFVRQYVIRLGFLDGVPGLLVCSLAGFSVFMKYAKLWAIERAMPQPDPEADQASASESPAPSAAEPAAESPSASK